MLSEKQIGVRMPAELVEALEVTARAQGVPVAEVVRRACRSWIAATAEQLVDGGAEGRRNGGAG